MSLIKSAMRAIGVTLAGGILYVGSLVGFSKLASLNSPEIKSQGQLEQLLGEERASLEIGEDIFINAIFNSDYIYGCYGYATVSCSWKSAEKEYTIIIPVSGTVSDLKHEIYHIADGHTDWGYELTSRAMPEDFDDFKFWAYYLFYAEPQAVIYELTGLKP